MQNADYAKVPTWQELASAIHHWCGVKASPQRVALFALGVHPGNDAANDLAGHFRDFSEHDWASLMQIAEAEHVHTWITHRICKSSLGCPAGLTEAALNRARSRAPWNRLLVMATLDAVNQLESEGLDVLVLKGPALAKQLYGDELLRDTRDIDILVAPECVSTAVTSLERRGYSCDVEINELRSKRYLWRFRQTSLIAFGGALEIDLHWKLSNAWLMRASPIELRDFGDRVRQYSVRVGLLSGQVNTLRPDVLSDALRATIANSHEVELKAAMDLLRAENPAVNVAVPTCATSRTHWTIDLLTSALTKVSIASGIGLRSTVQDILGGSALRTPRTRRLIWYRNVLRSLRMGNFATLSAAALYSRFVHTTKKLDN